MPLRSTFLILLIQMFTQRYNTNNFFLYKFTIFSRIFLHDKILIPKYFKSYNLVLLPFIDPFYLKQARRHNSESLAHTYQPRQTEEHISKDRKSKSDDTTHLNMYSINSVGRAEK